MEITWAEDKAMMGINSSAVQGLKQGEADLISLILL